MASGYNNWNDKGFRSLELCSTLIHALIHTTILFPLGYGGRLTLMLLLPFATAVSCYVWTFYWRYTLVYGVFKWNGNSGPGHVLAKYVRDLLISNCTKEFNLLNIFALNQTLQSFHPFLEQSHTYSIFAIVFLAFTLYSSLFWKRIGNKSRQCLDFHEL